MNFNAHYTYKDKHAFLGASKHAWLNYTPEKLAKVYHNMKAQEYGTRLHELAKNLIELNQKLPGSKKTLNMYVNDAIGFKMRPEQILYYSDNCFGTADAISYEKRFLRIHDLKTGVTPVHFEQLMIYAALFCLEYNINPNNIKCELRIYQNDDILFYKPEGEEIKTIMSKVESSDLILNKLKEEEGTTNE